MGKTKKVFKGISSRCKLLLDGDEGTHVDFKRSAKGLTSDDLVAFANSDTGGTMLLGVDEMEDARGRQKGKVVGCEVSDSMKLLITNRAFGCIPPIPIKIFVENNSKKPFYRVEIPGGDNKPYCTSGGTYKIREDGRNKILQPDELLAIFLKTESNRFANRYKEAASEHQHEDMALLQAEISIMHKKLNTLIKKKNKRS